MRALAVLALLAPFPAIAAPPVVAVFAVEDGRPKKTRLPDTELNALTAYLTAVVGESGRLRVVPDSALQAALRESKAQQARDGCYDESCQVEIGKAVAAEKTLAVKLTQIGAVCLVTGQLYDLRAEATDRTASTKGACGSEDLLGSIEVVARELLGGAPKAAVAGIGWVDQQRALRECREGKRAMTRLKATFEASQAALDAKQQELKRLQERAQRLHGAEAERAKAELSTRTVALQKEFTERQAALQREESEATGAIVSRMEPIIEALAKERGLTIVRDAKPAGPHVDLTDELVRRLDAP